MKHLVLRRLRPLVFASIVYLALGGTGHAQGVRMREGADAGTSSPEKKVIERRVRMFYAWWVGQANKNRSGLDNRAMLRAYSSRRLARWLYSPAYRDYDADYFTQAQDLDPDWTQVRTRDVRVQGNTARLTATLGSPKSSGKGIGPQTLRLKLVKENGVWKIDRVAPVGD